MKGKKRARDEKEKNVDEPATKEMKTPSTTDFSKTDFDKCERTTEDGKTYNLKISSWNVAGLRACVKKGFADYIKHENADIYCLQETKCPDDKLPSDVKVPGYHRYFLSGDKAGYAGVAVYSKEKPLEVKYGIGKKEYDVEGRLITAEYEKFYFVAVYVVNAGQGLCNLNKRMEWDKTFREFLKDLDSKKPVILAGDLNVAHNPIDLANPQSNTKSAGFTIEERNGFTELLSCGFTDSFRKLYPEKKGAYSYWTYFRNARAKNTGWRLDYFVLSERLIPNVCDNVMRTEVFGSDHCPIVLFLHI
ncbi:exodeoxyribonuclease-like isoform X2 [Lycorma delicatula]|uniref:exodeoxyribonuclease-like isoform X2 n=1 Tax=Lycorma delicatula TaxID=130591 RepID=UPI003F513D0D